MGKNYSKPHGTLSERRKRSTTFFSRKSTIVPFTLHPDETTSAVSPRFSPPVSPPVSLPGSPSVSPRSSKKPDAPSYIFPVNEKETGLMQARHYLYKEIWGGNFA